MQALRNSPSFGYVAFDRDTNMALACGQMFEEELIPRLRDHFPEYAAQFEQLKMESSVNRPFVPYLGSSFLGFVRLCLGDSFVVLDATELAFSAVDEDDAWTQLRYEMYANDQTGICFTDSDAIKRYDLKLHREMSADIQTVGRFQSFAAAKDAMVAVLNAMPQKELDEAKASGEFFIVEMTMDGQEHCDIGSVFGVAAVLSSNG